MVPGLIEADDIVVCVPDDHDVASRTLPAPSGRPQVEHVMQIDDSKQRRSHAPYTKGNFQFVRTIAGWRERYELLDLRRKK